MNTKFDNPEPEVNLREKGVKIPARLRKIRGLISFFCLIKNATDRSKFLLTCA